jgi:TonB family protein
MSRIISQSLFRSETAPARSWQSYVTSGAVHVGVIAALCFISFPAVNKIVKPQERATLISPVLPVYKPKVVPQPIIRHPIVLKKEIIVKNIPKPLIPPPVVKPPEPKPQLLAKAPEVKEIAPVPVDHLPETKLAPPAPPKPEVHTGVFASDTLAKGARAPHELKVGGFGDPNGVHTSPDSRPAPVMMARLGGFDMPNGEGHSGGGGRAQNGGVHAAGFGSAGDPNGVPGGTGTHGSVRTGGFGDGTVASAGHAQTRQIEPSTTPVEILFKPKPVYTQEARSLRLEGQVSIQVLFLANGGVKIVHVVHGLGHGLDEAAEQAAMQVRFRPATRDGVPVDTSATIYITFELT